MPDPELLPVHRPRCPKCNMRMIFGGAKVARPGFEIRTFECLKCNHAEVRVLPADPVATHGFDDWLSGKTGTTI